MANLDLVDKPSVQGAFEDLWMRFLGDVRYFAGLNHALPLARAVGKFFGVCTVEVLWIPNAAKEKGGFSACGARWSSEGKGEEIDVGCLTSLAGGYKSRVFPQNREAADFPIEISSDASEAVYVISRGLEPTRIESLWLIIRSPENHSIVDRFSEKIQRRHELLRSRVNYLETIYTMFVAVHRAPWASILSANVRSFVGKIDMVPQDRIEGATGLLRSASDIWADAKAESSLKFARDIAESVVQSLIGNGVDVHPPLLTGCQDTAKEFITELQALLGRGRSTDNSDTKIIFAQLEALCRAVKAIATDPEIDKGCTACQSREEPAIEGGEDRERDHLIELDLLADWTGLHQHARWQRLKVPSRRTLPQESWYPWAHRTFGRLKYFLLRHFLGNAMSVPYVPPWLRLWFCHTLLYQAGRAESPGEAWNNWRFCEHLSYVVRESLRVFIYGKRTDYSFRAPALAEALRTLVEHHALHVLHLPNDPDIRGILTELSSMHSSLGYFYVSGHLQHVLEVYIAGQFSCDLTVDLTVEDGKEDIWTVEQILASRSAWKPLKDSLSTGEFRRAFSLAALFHDVGRLLLPRWRPTAERWLQVDKALLKNLGGVEDSLLDALAGLMKECAQDLATEGYYTSADAGAIWVWVEDMVERREVDFALISAWFLHRLCQNVSGLHGDTVRQAVRAVLLHQMVTQVVHVDRDPAAALLILCDQIFAWNANKVWVTPGETGHSFQAIAADVRPQPSLFELLGLEGLKEESTETESVDPLRFRVDPSGQDLWPHFFVALRKPEGMEVPLIWIGLAQNLCRIKPSSKHNWAPRVTVRSEIPPRMLNQGHCTFDLLEEAVGEDRSALHGSLSRFLKEAKPGATVDGDSEQIELRPVGDPLHREDVSPLFPELERLLDKALSQREAGALRPE